MACDARIYVVCHRPDRVEELAGLTPILVGEAAARQDYAGLTDLLRDGSLLLNRRWSELSAIYKIWQDGPRSDVVGFYHYRRFLNFSETAYRETWNRIDRAALRSPDVRLTPPDYTLLARGGILVTARQQMFDSAVAERYGQYHIQSDYALMSEIIALEAPFLCPEIERQRERRFMYANNLLITNRGEFDELCSYWYAVLKRVAARLQWPRGMGSYQDRDVAFLSERFFDAWIRYRQNQGYKILERPMLYVEA